MKEFQTPIIEIITFTTADVITTSFVSIEPGQTEEG